LLLFPSGFQANLAAVSVLADRLIRHYLLVGVRASGARLQRLPTTPRRIWIRFRLGPHRQLHGRRRVPAGGPFASAPDPRILGRELMARRHSMTSTGRGRRLVFAEPVPIV
jgi:hypothetical protein